MHNKERIINQGPVRRQRLDRFDLLHLWVSTISCIEEPPLWVLQVNPLHLRVLQVDPPVAIVELEREAAMVADDCDAPCLTPPTLVPIVLFTPVRGS